MITDQPFDPSNRFRPLQLPDFRMLQKSLPGTWGPSSLQAKLIKLPGWRSVSALELLPRIVLVSKWLHRQSRFLDFRPQTVRHPGGVGDLASSLGQRPIHLSYRAF